MTREEALKEMKEEFNEFLEGTGLDNEEYLKSEMKTNEDLKKVVEANRMAIKALEQKPILDKIRAEIDTARFIDKDTKLCKNANASGLEVAMQIIDKYKSESEK